MKKILMVLVILAYFSTTGVAFSKERIFVSIPPVKYFVERISGGEFEVSSLLEQGEDPHTFEPRPKQMMDLSRSSIFFTIGLELERSLLSRIIAMNKDIRVISLDDGIEKLTMTGREHLFEDHHEVEHPYDHDHQETHSIGSFPDPHIWNSPLLVGSIALEITGTLLELFPEKEDRWRENYLIFQKEITELHEEIGDLFKDMRGSSFIVFHPSWGYFARDYGLVQIPVEIEGKEPKPADLKQLMEIAREKETKSIFVSPQFSSRSATILADQIGADIIAIDPLAEDWINNIRQVAHSLAKSMKEE